MRMKHQHRCIAESLSLLAGIERQHEEAQLIGVAVRDLVHQAPGIESQRYSVHLHKHRCKVNHAKPPPKAPAGACTMM